MKTTIITEFSYENQPNVKVTHETDGITLDELIESFEDHLRGCGFIVDGHIEFIEDEKEEI